MVDGKLYKFVEKKYNGDVMYTSVFPDTRIGGLMPSRETIPISLIHPLKHKLEYALLEIGVIVPEEKVHWRVKVNGISVTKEFKPHAIAWLGNELFAKTVYDITSILKTPESLRRKRINVTFKTEGSTNILIKHIGVLTLYPTDEATSYISFLSGALSLKPGEEEEIKIDYPGDNGELKTVMFIPSKASRSTLIINGDKSFDIEGVQGIDELVLSMKDIGSVNSLKIIHREAEETYYPKEICVSTILLSKQVFKLPKIDVIDIEIPEKIPVEGGKINVKIRNSGETEPDKIIVVLMSHGNVVSREKIEPIPVGGEFTVEVPVKLPEGEHQLVLRIIWNKLSRTQYIDRRIVLRVG